MNVGLTDSQDIPEVGPHGTWPEVLGSYFIGGDESDIEQQGTEIEQ